jgi:hypothetical protein
MRTVHKKKLRRIYLHIIIIIIIIIIVIRVWGRGEACKGFGGETWGKGTTGETQAQMGG